MFDCKKCGKCFRDSYSLTRHESRKVPCVKNSENTKNKNLSNETKNLSNETKNLSNQTINLSNETINTCEFCLNRFFSKYTKNKHQPICKEREDPVRLLEIEKGVKPPTAVCKTECRFCNKDFFNSSSLYRHFKVCKEREEYRKGLLTIEKPQQATTIINNYGTINNNTINNNLICNFGEESLDHITNKDFLSLVNKFAKKTKNVNDINELKLIQGKFIIDFGKLINKNPENQNSWITNVKSDFGVIKRNNEEQLLRFPDFVEEVLVNTSKKLSVRHDTFSENNDLDDDSNELLNEAYEFQHGAEHYQDLPKKHLKELNDSIRINNIKK
jgi:hypothetical protein